MTPQQLVIDLFPDASYASEKFLTGDSNRIAARLLMEGEVWPSHALILHGPPRSGKTHLARIWADRANARFLPAVEFEAFDVKGQAAVIEDADRITDEAALFHLHNLARESGGQLLLTSRVPPAGWGFSLPDLTSRLLATPVAEITEPDDALLEPLMHKLADDRQMLLAPEVARYLSERLQRSFATAERAIRVLDQAALAGKRRLTKPLARTYLDQIEGAE